MSNPFLLAVIYWLHMLATVLWIGGLLSQSLLALPAARKVLRQELHLAFTLEYSRRLQTLGWFALAVLALTGMFQMSAHPQYQGFLAVNSLWGWALLIKHGLILLMAAVNAWLAWALLPDLRRLAGLSETGREKHAGRLERLKVLEARLLWVNLGLSALVLAFTALARAS